MIKIIPVETKRQLRQFIDFPHELYQADKNYVPEIFMAQRDMLTRGKHPSHAHITFQLFLAYSGEEIVGRIASIHNQNHIDYTQRNDGFFGFFDAIDDDQVSQALFGAAFEFLKSKGIENVIGPVNFSTNDPLGTLIKGFEASPQIMMTYNKPYYGSLLENVGFVKKMDLLAYWFDIATIPDRVLALAKKIEERLNRNGITIRTINLKDFKNEVKKIKDIYNQAWDKNWGFVPMTEKEFDYVAKDMKLLMDKDFVLVAEKDKKLIGFTLCLPNLNEVLINVKKGRLFPTGIFKILFGKSKIKSLRVLTLGILEQYRSLGIGVCFYARLTEKAKEKGFVGGEASWILETNDMMNRELKNIKSEVSKTYRLYEKSIG
ncbi:MAG: hypothetical protein AAF573_11340 [Bacteroidota bacterium]